MGAPTNTVTDINNVGGREDLEDDIYRIAPEKTPFTSNIGKVKATAIEHEWQTEALASPDATNAHLEGDDVGTLDAANIPVRVKNICQIYRKTGGVSRTQEIVDKAGRSSELERQKLIKGVEMRTDIEARAIGNYASNVEAGSTARKMGGALAWIETNDSLGAGGSSGGYSSGVVGAATPGTSRTFTETQVKSVLATGFSNGAQYSQAYMGPTHKQQFSAFQGIADIRVSAEKRSQATIIGAADVYVSDFGNITLIPHQYGLTADCLFIDPSMWAMGTLDGMKTKKLAKSGDSEKFMMTCEKTLVCRNELGGAAVRALS